MNIAALEGTEAYNASNFKESDSISPLCFIIDGVLDIESFNILLIDLKRFKPIAIKIFKFIYFLSLEIGIDDFKSYCFKKFQSMNYTLRSFFLKKSISESIINHFSFVKENAYYLFYEENENYILNTEIFPNAIKIQTTSTYPRKILYEFFDFSELSTSYIKIFPIYAILPIKFTSNNHQMVKTSFKFANNVNRLTYPLFSPFRSIYYVSFIERFSTKPQRKMNVEELYSIHHIFDVQISHLLQSEPDNIRTFLGFDNKFRCLLVFDYLINQKCFKNVIFLDKNNQIKRPELTNIKFNLFYIEIQKRFDSSFLFSIEYKNSFLFNNDSFCSNDQSKTNDYSTFLSFEKKEEMIKAKQMINSLMQNNSPYVIKILKLIDQKDLFLLFPNEKFNEYLFYMIIHLKYFNKTDIPKINNEFLKKLQKVSKSVRYDLVSSSNNKPYFVVGFDNNQKRNDAFLNLKTKHFMSIQCHYYKNSPSRNVMGKEQQSIKKEPLFKPKDGLFYIYFEEYQRSKLKYPSSKVRPLFGIQNISDLQRNYFLSNDSKEYTFVGFAKEENVIELINQISLKQHIICTNALDGKIYRFINDKSQEKTDTINNKSANIFKDTQKIINKNKDSNKSNAITQNNNANSNANSNAITPNNNNNSNTIAQKINANSNKITSDSNTNSNAINKNIERNPSNINQNNNNKTKAFTPNSKANSNAINKNIDNSPNKSNQNNNNYSNEINQNSNNYSNEISQNNNNYSNEISQNNNNYSNEINQNNNNYSNEISQNNNNYSNEISNNSSKSDKITSKKEITKVSDEKYNHKITEIKKEDINSKDDKTPKANINENNNKTSIQNKIGNNIYYNYINKKENSYLKIDLKKYELKKHLGSGQYGNVFIVEEKSTNKKYAAKISMGNKHEDFIQEIYFYSKFKYPFILSIHGYSLTDFNNKQHITMVLDYMPNGSLEEALKKTDSLSKPAKYLIIYGIVIGMKYLHSQSVVHRDLKPANILLDENNYPRICDNSITLICSLLEKLKNSRIIWLRFMNFI